MQKNIFVAIARFYSAKVEVGNGPKLSYSKSRRLEAISREDPS